MKIASRHEESQHSSLILWAFIVLMVVAILGSALATDEWVPALATLPLAVIAGGLLFVFTAFYVTVAGSTVTWSFRAGFWRKQIDLADIAEVSAVTNPLWMGWGIRRFPGGWLYNVGGRGAVEIKTDGGRVVRLGSDNPERLVTAIQLRLPRS